MNLVLPYTYRKKKPPIGRTVYMYMHTRPPGQDPIHPSIHPSTKKNTRTNTSHSNNLQVPGPTYSYKSEYFIYFIDVLHLHFSSIV